MNGQRGEGGVGGVFSGTFTLQKWQSDVTAIVTHKPAPLYPFFISRMTRGGEGQGMKTGKKEERVYLGNISLPLRRWPPDFITPNEVYSVVDAQVSPVLNH